MSLYLPAHLRATYPDQTALQGLDKSMSVARAKTVGISPWKLRRVMNMVRGMLVEEADILLENLNIPAARAVREVLLSAIANAENNDNENRDNLYVAHLFADQGPRTKRWRARSRGRTGSFDRPTSHITVEVEAG